MIACNASFRSRKNTSIVFNCAAITFMICFDSILFDLCVIKLILSKRHSDERNRESGREREIERVRVRERENRNRERNRERERDREIERGI
jgi:hypothetical protein